MTEEQNTTTCGCVWGDHPEANMNCRYPALLKAAEEILAWWDTDAVGQLNVYAVLYPMFSKLREATK